MNPIFNDTFKLLIALFSVLNPLGAIPTFLALTGRNSEEEINRISRVCSFTVFITLMIALFLGPYILGFFGITIASFKIGAGILIATLAFNMLSARPTQSKISEEEIERHINVREIGIVPLAIPLLSGPSSISTVIIYSEHFTTTYHWIGAVVVFILLSLMVKYILRSARKIGASMGRTGLNVFTRVMGLILMAIAIEAISFGLKQIFPALSA